ncbi:MAG: helix-turn-helix transcriptional regulator [Polyangiaceae bacterium]|nr:helix-turn-helix transcriptional regulator [Polyangiaceae bacterium]
MWQPPSPNLRRLSEVVYDLTRDTDAWLKDVLDLLMLDLPGAMAGVVGMAEVMPAGLRPLSELVATSSEAREVALRYAQSHAPDYVATRLREKVVTDGQIERRSPTGTPHGEWIRAFGGRDGFGVSAFGKGGRGLAAGIVLADRAEDDWPPALLEQWRTVAMHLGAAAEFRAAAAQGHAHVLAVFKPEGEVEGAPDSTDSRDALRDAVLTLDRARSGRRDRGHAASALDVPGPTQESFQLVDQFESDGKHFVVAYVTDDDVPLSEVPLSIQESRVAHYLVGGWSAKRIAYQLGIKPGTVANYAHRIYKKLGVRGRMDLALALAARKHTSG